MSNSKFTLYFDCFLNKCDLDLFSRELCSSTWKSSSTVPTLIVMANSILKRKSQSDMDILIERDQENDFLLTIKTSCRTRNGNLKSSSLEDLAQALQAKRAKSNFSKSVARKKSRSLDRANLDRSTYKKYEILTPVDRTSDRPSPYKSTLCFNWYSTYKENKQDEQEASRIHMQHVKGKFNGYGIVLLVLDMTNTQVISRDYIRKFF